LEVLGRFQGRLSSGRPLQVRSAKAQALLAFLACSPERVAERQTLSSLLWGRTSGTQAKHSLRQALLGLRAALGADAAWLAGDVRGVSLDDARWSSDVWDFERLARRNDVTGLRRATALYRGDLLEGFGPQNEAIDRWLLAERERLHELAVGCHARLLRLLELQGQIDEAIAVAMRLLALEPLDAEARRALMRLYESQGRLGTAVRHYENHLRLLDAELRVRPDAETRQLYRDMLERGRAETAPQRQPAKAERPQPTIFAVSPFLLLVDHDAAERARLQSLLTNAEWSVVACEDAAGALLKLGKWHFDVVLIRLPTQLMDGLELVKTMKRMAIQAPVAVLADDAGELETRSLDAGAADFVRLPFSDSVLLARLRNLHDGRVRLPVAVGGGNIVRPMVGVERRRPGMRSWRRSGGRNDGRNSAGA
jgi:DNA-binding SARP family transcriptional activator/CheY-like chemotaxis protein